MVVFTARLNPVDTDVAHIYATYHYSNYDNTYLIASMATEYMGAADGGEEAIKALNAGDIVNLKMSFMVPE